MELTDSLGAEEELAGSRASGGNDGCPKGIGTGFAGAEAGMEECGIADEEGTACCSASDDCKVGDDCAGS